MTTKLSKSLVGIALSKLKVFEKAKVREEQYPTDPEIAADILWTAHMQGDIDDKIIADLGAGTGILGIGALILGAKKVYFVEKDENAINIAQENLKKIKSEYDIQGDAIFVNGDITHFDKTVDVIIENPPFGTKEKHADKHFLEKAMQLADTIYTLHKTTSVKFVKAIADDKDFAIKGKLNFNFALKQTMRHHKQKIKRIKVSMWKLKRKK